jgi:flavin-dependent dehydrogenase
MIKKDVIIIGGGPAGSSCALKLKEYGFDTLILDKHEFPRLKLCAGWITPRVYQLLNMDEYPNGIIEFNRMHIHYYTNKNKEIKFTTKTKQYSIRRYEFDHWLLKKSGSDFMVHEVKKIEQIDGYYIIDDKFQSKYLVGAGGTHCPVFRTFFKEINPRSKDYQIGALEIEFPYEYTDRDCYLWFCENSLPGYSWYVPKENGYLNIGLGAFSHKLGDKSLKWHFDYFVEKLKKIGLLKHFDHEPKGHTYYLREPVKKVYYNNACIIGDSAGLATKDLGEGIGPAIESGIKAASWIALKKELDLSDIPELSIDGLKGKIIYYLLKYSMFNVKNSINA